MESKTCNNCHFPILDTYRFCPSCGKKVNEVLSLGIGAQLGIYALSIILPPLGLWPGIKYLRSSNEKAKIIGVIAIVLTIVSTVLTIWLSFGLLGALFSGIGGGAGQIDSLQGL